MTFEEKFQKAVVNYKGKDDRMMGTLASLLHWHDVGKMQNLIETETLWNKNQKLHKGREAAAFVIGNICLK